MLPYLKGHKGFGYVDGTSLLKPSLLLMDLHVPTNLILIRKPKIILSMHQFFSFIQVTGTSCLLQHVLWILVGVSSAFASQSHAKEVQVWSQLSTLRKGSLYVSDYFMTIKHLTDELAIVGQPLICDDIITYLLVGLGLDYNSLIFMVTYRDTSLILEEVYSMLLTCEARIQHNNQFLSLLTASANVVTQQLPLTGR